jgi:DNA (cytosine-5)-methyltransferase 1
VHRIVCHHYRHFKMGRAAVMELNVLEICAGAGGQAVGLEAAGFEHVAAIEIDRHACDTMRKNRPHWNVLEESVINIDGSRYRGIDLLAGGVPCPPFSIAGKQLGSDDARDLFPEAIRLVAEAKPAAVMLENVPGFASARFVDYRRNLLQRLSRLGYESDWRVLNASWFGVPQLRPRFVLVAFRGSIPDAFEWPEQGDRLPPTVGEALEDLMASRGWEGVEEWRDAANGIAPTLVGGSKKHGGPDLGPTRARKRWASLGVDGLGIADEPPGPEHSPDLRPRLTVKMAARIQGFPDAWTITGRKTAAYRQVGNAFPPPVAQAVGTAIRTALLKKTSRQRRKQLPLFQIAQ